MNARRNRAAVSTLLVLMLVAGVTLSGLCGKPVPPDRPVIVAGPTQGGTGISYDFAAIATSPEGDSVAIRFDWGDGDTSDWSGLVASGDTVWMHHAWTDTGMYDIKAQARDKAGRESDWSEPHQVAIDLPPGTLKWRYEVGGAVSSPAIGADGTVYVGSGSGYLYAIKPDGTLRWRYRTGGSRSSPAIAADGTVYVGSEDCYLYAVNPDGTLRWRYEAEGPARSSPAIAADGTVYIGSCDHYLYAIYPNGTLKWRRLTSSEVESSPVIAADGTVYIGSSEDYLYAFNPDGSLKWRYEINWGVASSPAIAADGTVYVGAGDNHFYAINPDGTLKWRYEAEGSLWSSPAIGAEGTIYVGASAWGEACYFYAVNPDGTLKWQYRIDYHPEPGPNPHHAGPAVGTGDTVFSGSLDRDLHALNPDGTLKWRYQTEEDIRSAPAIGADGTLYVGCTGGYLYAIRSASRLADTPWPRFRHDNRNTGRFGGP